MSDLHGLLTLPAQTNRLVQLSTTLGPDRLLVDSAHFTESISALPEMVVDCLSSDANIDLNALIGTAASLRIELAPASEMGMLDDVAADGSAERYFSGLVSAFERTGADGGFTTYRLTLQPWLWLLGQSLDTRVWQNVTAMDIAEAVFQEYGVPDYRVSLQGQLPTYDYLVQYRESPLNLVRRLFEQEGLFWWFEFEPERQMLVIADHPQSHRQIDGYQQIAFHGDDTPFLKESVTDWQHVERFRTGQVRYRDYYYEAPSAPLDVSTPTVVEQRQLKRTEVYDSDSLYDYHGDGDRYSRLAMMAQETQHRRVRGKSTVRALSAGRKFTLTQHFQDNGDYLLIQVRHRFNNNWLAGETRPAYQGEFQAIPFAVPFKPERRLPKPRVEGPLSAVVVGPPGEEIHTDRYGRVKIQFHWDRRQPRDDSASIYVRVSQPWADADWGGQFIPRIGQEVLVSFIQGDPDHPLITGRVYNGEKLPAWHTHGELSGFKSKTHKGSGFNALLFDDANDKERVRLSSEKHQTQLNQGFLVHSSALNDRGAHRGDGFELRTDAWGAIRTARGLFISTDARFSATSSQLDHREANEQLKAALGISKALSDNAVHHRAGALQANQSLEHFQQVSAKPDSNGVNTFGEPILLASSPAGIGLSTPKSIQQAADENIHLISQQDTNFAVGRNWVVSAGETISLFVQQNGMKLFAGKGKVEVQAQDDAVEVTANKNVEIVSTNQQVNVAAKQHIRLSCGGAYIQLDEGGNIEIHAPGQVSIKGNPVAVSGPAGRAYNMPSFPVSGKSKLELFHHYANGQPVKGGSYTVEESNGATRQGKLDDKGYALEHDLDPGSVKVQFHPDPRDPNDPGSYFGVPKWPEQPFTPDPASLKAKALAQLGSLLPSGAAEFADMAKQAANGLQQLRSVGSAIGQVKPMNLAGRI